MKDVSYYSSFLNKLRAFSQEVGTATAEVEILRFRQLITGFAEVKAAAIETDKREASDYCLFDILNISRRETVTHTPFLLNLLNPLGTHSQGELFYRSFLYKFGKTPDCFLSFRPESFIARQEWPAAQYGRIDLMFYHKHQNNRFAWVIENKIDAGDQDQQVSRYFEYLSNELRITPERMRIFYLTKYGTFPGDHSIEKTLREQLIAQDILHILSYKNHILPWLMEIQNNILADSVRFTVQQYIHLLKKIAP